MKLLLLVFSLSLATFGKAQEVELMKFPELQKRIISTKAPLTLFNFWATWCGPCVKEIPHFEAYTENEDVKVVLVSLDFPDKLEAVIRFVKKKGWKSEVILLDETDYNSYMGKVNANWSGAIPATLFVDEWGKSYFHEGELTKEELENKVKSYLN